MFTSAQTREDQMWVRVDTNQEGDIGLGCKQVLYFTDEPKRGSLLVATPTCWGGFIGEGFEACHR